MRTHRRCFLREIRNVDLAQIRIIHILSPFYYHLLSFTDKIDMCNSLPRWLSWLRIRLVISRLRVRPLLDWQHSFMEIDHEIFSVVILSLPLIQEGQMSVSGKTMCTIPVYLLED